MRASSKWVSCLTGLAVAAGLTAGQTYAQQSGSSATTGDQPSEQTGATAELKARAQETLNTFKQTDPSLDKFFSSAAGYAVFPKVGEGALIVGGARGQGIVYQNGQPVGKATVTKGTVGAQIGGASYSELVFFQTPQALQDFKAGNYEMSAAVSAVAASSGAAQTANYKDGVAVFTTGRQGVMAQAAVGGQKFSFQPLPGAPSSNEGVGGSSSPGSSGSSSGQEGSAPK